MRKFVLIAAIVLASVSARAGDRSLSLGPEMSAATVPARPADTAKAAEAAPAVEAPKAAEAPTYVERPALAQPQAGPTRAEAPGAQPGKRVATKTASASKTEKPRRKRYWTEERIIGELHRHGIDW